MSGTSLDGVDAVVASFNDDGIKIHRHLEKNYPAKLRSEFLTLCTPGENELHRLQLVAHQRAELVADIIGVLCSELDPNTIIAIADHGQTVRHFPMQTPPYTVQVHHGALLAELTQIDCVVDFRSKDIAAGGQGAPLVPAFHQAFFANQHHYRIIINIGGMANISLLGPNASEALLGFDTGPGNTLLDAWCKQHTGKPYDDEGHWAASGTTHKPLLEALLKDNYFMQTPPKSTGREQFNMIWLMDTLSQPPYKHLKPEDVQATLTEFTVSSILIGVEQACKTCDITDAELDGIYICGGGTFNATLMTLLKQNTGFDVHTTQKLGVPPKQVEAAAFAWFGKQAVENQPSRLCQSTGARHHNVLGALYPA